MRVPDLKKGQALQEWKRFLLAESHVLRQNPLLLFQQALNRSDSSVPSHHAALRYESGCEKRPFLRRINKLDSSTISSMTLVGHGGPIRACAFSPEGLYIVSASEDGRLKVWDALTGQELAILMGHSLGVNDCAYSPDGSRIVSASDDMTLKVWDALSGNPLTTLAGHRNKVNACAFSPDGSCIASVSEDRSLRIWEAATGRERHVFFSSQRLTGCAFSPDGSLILTSSGVWDGEEYVLILSIWDAETGKELAALTYQSPERPAYETSPDETRIFPVRLDYTCAFSPDGSRIASTCGDASLKIWDAATVRKFNTPRAQDREGDVCESIGGDVQTHSPEVSAEVTLQGHGNSIAAFAFSSDGTRIVSASIDGTIIIWDAGSGKELARKPGRGVSTEDCVFSPDGSLILAASADGTLQLWKSSPEAFGSDLGMYRHEILECAFSPDGSYVVSASWSGAITLRDVDAGGPVTKQAYHNKLMACAVSRNGSHILSRSDDGMLILWDTATGKMLASKTCQGGFSFSPDGSRIAYADDFSAIHILDTAAVRETAVLRGHGDRIYSCTFHSDNTRIASASADQTARIWDAADGRELLVLAGHGDGVYGVVFSPGGTRVLTASWDGTLRIWDALKGTEIFSFAGYSDCLRSIISLDGSRVIFSSRDGSFRIGDTKSGSEKVLPAGHGGKVTACAFSPNDSVIVSVSRDGTLKILEAETGEDIWEYRLGAGATCLDLSCSGLIAAGTGSGDFHLLQLINPPCKNRRSI